MQGNCLAYSGHGFDTGRVNSFVFLPWTGIRRNFVVEPQSLISVSKYTWVKSKIPSQWVCYEDIYTVNSEW